MRATIEAAQSALQAGDAALAGDIALALVRAGLEEAELASQTLDAALIGAQALAAVGRAQDGAALLDGLAAQHAAGSARQTMLRLSTSLFWLSLDDELKAMRSAAAWAPTLVSDWSRLASGLALSGAMAKTPGLQSASDTERAFACFAIAALLRANGQFQAACQALYGARSARAFAERAQISIWSNQLSLGHAAPEPPTPRESELGVEHLTLRLRHALLHGRLDHALIAGAALSATNGPPAAQIRARLRNVRLLANLNLIPSALMALEHAQPLQASPGAERFASQFVAMADLIALRLALMGLDLRTRFGKVEGGGRLYELRLPDAQRSADPEDDIAAWTDQLLLWPIGQDTDGLAEDIAHRANASDSALLKSRAALALSRYALSQRALSAAHHWRDTARAHLKQVSTPAPFEHLEAALLTSVFEGLNALSLPSARPQEIIHHTADASADARTRLHALAQTLHNADAKEQFLADKWLVDDDALDFALGEARSDQAIRADALVEQILRWRAPTSMQATIHSGEALLVLVRSRRHSLIALKTGDALRWRISRNGREAIGAGLAHLHRAIEANREALVTGDEEGAAETTRVFKNACETIFCDLLGLHTVLTDESLRGVETLWIAAEGELRLAPLEAAPFGAGLLCDRVAIGHLAPGRRRERRCGVGMIFGFPEAARLEGEHPRTYRALPHAEAEAQSISDDWRKHGIAVDAPHLLTARERREKVLFALHNADLVHLACHGDFFPWAPSQSGLVIPDAAELQPAAILGFGALAGPFAAWHVAISACLTADGLAMGSGRVVSLPEVLCAGGVSHVVSHRWEAFDAVQPGLYQIYYQHLRRHSPVMSAAQARRAMRQGLAGTEHLTRHPAVWAGLMVVSALPH